MRTIHKASMNVVMVIVEDQRTDWTGVESGVGWWGRSPAVVPEMSSPHCRATIWKNV